MYTLAIRRAFEAWHHLIGGDWGAENSPHTHAYLLELRLEGDELDQHGYLVDLVDVEQHVDELLATYRGADLNTLPEFNGLNPSLEHFARIVCIAITDRLPKAGLRAITVQMWEHENAWASYRLDL
jgi:6-pyruvoyltetrahydropterin/6-carboxytetrahydropterin synthase